jgi:hypothetical protein
VIHHSGEVGKLYAVAMKVDSARRSMKSKVKNAVVSLAEQIEVVLELLTRIAREMAEFRLHRLRDQL